MITFIHYGVADENITLKSKPRVMSRLRLPGFVTVQLMRRPPDARAFDVEQWSRVGAVCPGGE